MLKKDIKDNLIVELTKLFPNAHCELVHHNDYEMLVSVMLSQQTTDEAVNKATPELFKRYPTIQSLSVAKTSDVYTYISKLGLAKTKSLHLVTMANQVIHEFHGRIPNTKEELEELAGVGRKTANVFLSEVYKIPCFAVDTHVERVTKRLDLVNASSTPLQIEAIMTSLYPKSEWIDLHHKLIFFGRYFCTARNPKCDECPFKTCSHKLQKEL